MYEFILQIIFMLSLAGIIYIFARAIPRVDEVAHPALKTDYFGNFLKKLPLEKADTFVHSMTEKTLRKIKIFVLKIDNFINVQLKNLRPAGDLDAAKPNIFSEAAKPEENLSEPAKSDEALAVAIEKKEEQK